MAKGLTPKQQLFVDEYLVDLNATQAAIRAGYSARNADKIGPELLGKTRVAEEIQIAKEKRSKRTGINQDRVLVEIGRVAFSDPRKMFDGTRLKRMDEIDDDTAAAISSIKVSTKNLGEGEVENIAEIKFWPKTNALEMAGKHTGIFSADNAQKKPEPTQNVYVGLPEHVLELIGK